MRFVSLAGAGAGVLALASVLTAAFACANDDVALIMGSSGLPIPPPIYLGEMNDLYCPGCSPLGVVTPEALFPVTGILRLPFDTSVAEGAAMLNETIEQQLKDGNDVTVVGFSQSSTVASLEMQDILNGTAGIDPTPDELTFVLTGDPSNPNGGMLVRLDLPFGSSPSIPSLGITFGGATPVTEYPTDIYTGEYDGFADFPRYPLDLLSDVNALFGIAFVHSMYPMLTTDQVANAVEVPTSAGYDGATTYYVIPTEDLPLLDPMRLIPVVGPVTADLLQPDLGVLVNLGYGDPDYGWVNADANVPTPIGLFPSPGDFEKLPGLLAQGTGQGITDAVHDLQDPSRLVSPAENPALTLIDDPLTKVQLSEIGFLPTETPPPTLSGIVTALGDAASVDYSSGVKPTVDIAEGVFIALPAYDAHIFLSELAAGNVLGAIGLPIAADVALGPAADAFGIGALWETSLMVDLDLVGPFVDVASLIP